MIENCNRTFLVAPVCFRGCLVEALNGRVAKHPTSRACFCLEIIGITIPVVQARLQACNADDVSPFSRSQRCDLLRADYSADVCFCDSSPLGTCSHTASESTGTVITPRTRAARRWPFGRTHSVSVRTVVNNHRTQSNTRKTPHVNKIVIIVTTSGYCASMPCLYFMERQD